MNAGHQQCQESCVQPMDTCCSLSWKKEQVEQKGACEDFFCLQLIKGHLFQFEE